MIYPISATTKVTKTFGYDSGNRMTRETDALGQSTYYGHDSSGRLTSITNPANLTTYYAYDYLGRFTSYRDPLNHLTSYAYDLSGNLTRETPPVSGTATSYEYNAINKATKTTRPTGDNIAYAYDDNGQLTKFDFSDAATTDIGLTYDDLGNILDMTGPATDLHYEYRGTQVTKETYAATGATMALDYNGAGLRSSATLPVSNEQLGYAYDSFGHLTRVYNQANGNNLATMDYDPDSQRLTKQSSYNMDTNVLHLEQRYLYDVTGKLTSQTNQGFDGSGTPQDSIIYEYTYNNIDYVSRIDITLPASNEWGCWNYVYTAAGQLCNVYWDSNIEGRPSEMTDFYYYDAAGNRTKYDHWDDLNWDGVTNSTYQYDANNRLTHSQTQGKNEGDVAYQWDAAGNLTRKEVLNGDVWVYQWDARNKLTKVRKQPAGGTMADVATYTYDAQGRRFQKTAGGTTTAYYQDGLTPVVEVTGSVTKRNRSIPGDLGNVIQTAVGTTSSFYAYDRIGNVIATFGDDGHFAPGSKATILDAFGRLRSSGPQPEFGQTTKELDADTGLYYFNARWYDSRIGLFISSSAKPQYEEEPYSFCHQNPLLYIDPTGEMSTPAKIVTDILIELGIIVVSLLIGGAIGAIVGAIGTGVLVICALISLSNTLSTKNAGSQAEEFEDTQILFKEKENERKKVEKGTQGDGYITRFGKQNL